MVNYYFDIVWSNMVFQAQVVQHAVYKRFTSLKLLSNLLFGTLGQLTEFEPILKGETFMGTFHFNTTNNNDKLLVVTARVQITL